MKTTLTALAILFAAFALGGCAETLRGVGNTLATQTATAAQSNAFAVDDAFSLSATTDPAEVARLCANIAEHKTDRNAAWESAKTVGGGVLRFVAGVASLAGYPVAGALDMVSGGVDAVEGYSAGVDAITTDSDIRCKGVS